MKNFVPISFLSFFIMAAFVSCVPKKKFVQSQQQVTSLRQDSTQLERRIAQLERFVSELESRNSEMSHEVDKVKQQLETTSREAAGKIASQQSLLLRNRQEMAEQQQKLESLQGLIELQKKNADALRQKIADALVKFNSSELTVTMKNGKVYVSLQENLLFPSGSAVVNPKGKEALGQLAEVLNANPDINVNIEGHTDSLPIRTKFEDNWALSTARSSSIVRILTKIYRVDPARVVASGHSSYDPVDTNNTAEGRARNRRTEIILSPKLDELYDLINGM
jgi:chemotaxis protein MotB